MKKIILLTLLSSYLFGYDYQSYLKTHPQAKTTNYSNIATINYSSEKEYGASYFRLIPSNISYYGELLYKEDSFRGSFGVVSMFDNPIFNLYGGIGFHKYDSIKKISVADGSSVDLVSREISLNLNVGTTITIYQNIITTISYNHSEESDSAVLGFGIKF